MQTPDQGGAVTTNIVQVAALTHAAVHRRCGCMQAFPQLRIEIEMFGLMMRVA
jgi:hypothetical protein